MKNKTKLKKASNKTHQTFLTHLTSQPTDSQEIYQGNFESEVADSGRSMVEMLGVLAVVGVLSVGGILGYKYAMTKYQANQIVNELNLTSSQMAIMLMRPHTADFELSLGDPYDDGHIATNAHAFNFGCGTGVAGEEANCASDDIEYFSEVQNLPKGVCQNLVQLVQNLPYLEEVLVNNTADTTGTLCEENSTVRCLFNADKNAVIDDNPDPEVTETETETDNHGCGVHAYWDDDYYKRCLCQDGWYNSDGIYYETTESNCTLSQAAADKKYCNNNGTWNSHAPGCHCNDGTFDESNNRCYHNGGCCQLEISSLYAPETTSTTTTPETSTTETGTPETTSTTTITTITTTTISCGEHAYYNGVECQCKQNWYNSDGGRYFQTNEDGCTISQEDADKKFCNDNGTWTDQGSCSCSNGQLDYSNKHCRDNGGCCQNFCTSNSDCGSGEYCYIHSGSSCSQEFSVSKTSGICYKATGTSQTISGLGNVTRSDNPMSWWSAERFCQSLGKQMVSLSDLGCTTTIGSAGCKDSQIRKDLYSAFSYSHIWTSDQAGDNCNAYKVYSYTGDVGTYSRSSSYHALCK